MAVISRTTHAPDALVHRHLGLARSLARRYAHPGGESLEDLEQVACLGLVKAAQRFEPERGIPFARYAVPTILGELRRHLRATRWPAHVPRALQEIVLRLGGVERGFRLATGREPSAEEAARELGCSIEELLEARLAARSRSPVSLDEPRGHAADDGSPTALHECLGRDDAAFERTELRDAVEQGLAQLEDARATAFRLRAEHELTLTEVAQRMGVSPTRASLLCRQAEDELRHDLADVLRNYN